LKAAILRFIEQPCSKLRDRCIDGQFSITEKVSPIVFRLKLPPRVRIHYAVHDSLLRKWNFDPEHANIAQRVPNVHDAERLEVKLLLDVAFNSNGIGLLIKVCWADPFNIPSEDTWEPMRRFKHVDVFSDSLRSDVYREFLATPDFVKFCNRLPAGTPKTPRFLRLHNEDAGA
jgi:hypothetical protein